MIDTTEVWNFILKCASDGRLASLPPACQIIFRANCYTCEIPTNGLSGLLYNLSPEYAADQKNWTDLRQTAAAMDEIGDTKVAEILHHCAERLEPVSLTPDPTWGNLLKTAFPNGELKSLEDVLMDHSNNSCAALEKYTLANIDVCRSGAGWPEDG